MQISYCPENSERAAGMREGSDVSNPTDFLSHYYIACQTKRHIAKHVVQPRIFLGIPAVVAWRSHRLGLLDLYNPLVPSTPAPLSARPALPLHSSLGSSQPYATAPLTFIPTRLQRDSDKLITSQGSDVTVITGFCCCAFPAKTPVPAAQNAKR